MVTHLFSTIYPTGAHTGPGSDGYPEGWYLPAASNIPEGYATDGQFFKFERSDRAGTVTATYQNDQPTTTLWYHDHSLGITRLNVYASAAGFYLIREKDDRESGEGKKDKLPGPPPKIGDDPNSPGSKVRKQIREIPIAIQPKGFYEDGSHWYPANRQYFEDLGQGICYADNSMLQQIFPDLTFLPTPGADMAPILNPEAFFDTMVVNGNTWPYLDVATQRYRMRILNAADSNALNLALFKLNRDGSLGEELPFFVIGSDQSLLPCVVKLSTGFAEFASGKCTYINPYEMAPNQALLMGPSERYDVIVDFGHLKKGDEVVMINTAPNAPFASRSEDLFPSNDALNSEISDVGEVMKFIVTEDAKGDDSTPPEELEFDENPGALRKFNTQNFVRTVSLNELESEITGTPTEVLLGSDLSGQMPVDQKWGDPITTVVKNGTVELWEIENFTADSHPIHVHLVHFAIVERVNPNVGQWEPPAPYELGWKDTVLSYPDLFQTRIRSLFDKTGLYVWHCHILSHEDNEMMLPMCVAEGGDCFETCGDTCFGF